MRLLTLLFCAFSCFGQMMQAIVGQMVAAAASTPVVQVCNNTYSGDTSFACVLTAGVASGHLAVVVGMGYNPTGAMTVNTDPRGNAYTSDQHYPATPGGKYVVILHSVVSTALQPGDTITLVVNGNANYGVAIYDLQPPAAAPVDVGNAAAGAYALTWTLTAGNTTASDICVNAWFATTYDTPMTVDATWNALPAITGISYLITQPSWKQVAASSSSSNTITLAGYDDGSGVTQCYKKP